MCTWNTYPHCHSWSTCSRSCGGGRHERKCESCLFYQDKWFYEDCNEHCYYGNPYYSGRCQCPSWRYGDCCETCRHINIAHCKSGKQMCGGNPDNIKCTECDDPYYPAGYGNGCKEQSIVLTNPANNEIKVRENTTAVSVCKTLGIPVATIRWYKDQNTTNTTDDEEITMFANITSTSINGVKSVTSTLMFSPQKDDNGAKIYCTAINSANNTISSNKALLNVMYPPKLQRLHEKSIEAGSQLNLTFPFEKGNPQETFITWTRNGDSKEWNGETLLIENVTKYDDMIYTCTVKNILKQPGALQEIGRDSKSFHLNVLYVASITSFFVNGSADTPYVTVIENDNVLFVCTVDSNPNSTIEMKFQNEILVKQNDAESLYFSLDSASCLNDGVYTCSARNQYISDQYSVRILTLFVRCSPRPLLPPVETVTSALGVSATFQFMGIAYPTPSFTWEKEDNTSWKILTNSSDILISISGVNTYLTISNVSLQSYGKYQLKIKNDIDEFVQPFYLVAAEEKRHERVERNKGAVVGGVIGGILICIVIGIVGLLCYRRYGFKCKDDTKLGSKEEPYKKIGSKDEKDNKQNIYFEIDGAKLGSKEEPYKELGSKDRKDDKQSICFEIDGAKLGSKEEPYIKLGSKDGRDEKENIYLKIDETKLGSKEEPCKKLGPNEGTNVKHNFYSKIDKTKLGSKEEPIKKLGPKNMNDDKLNSYSEIGKIKDDKEMYVKVVKRF